MPWYRRTIEDTVESTQHDESETDRMWRQIDPSLAYVMRQHK